MFKKFLLLTLCILSAVYFLGCGKQESPKDKSNTLKEINQRQKVIVATEATFAPYEFVQDGKIIGYGSDILAEVVKNLNVELEQHDMDFKGILPALDEKKVDFVATAIVATPERQEKYGLTTPIGISEFVYVKKTGNNQLTSRDQLSGKKIGCITGGSLEPKLNKYREQLIQEGKEPFEIVSFTSTPETFIGLKNGQIDTALFNKTVAIETIKNNPDTYEIFDTFSDKKDYITWILRKDDKELLERINFEIIKLKNSGKLTELQEKWFGYSFDLPDEI